MKLEVRRRDRHRSAAVTTTDIDVSSLTETRTLERELVVPEHARLAAGEPATVRVTLNVAEIPRRVDTPSVPEQPGPARRGQTRGRLCPRLVQVG